MKKKRMYKTKGIYEATLIAIFSFSWAVLSSKGTSSK